MPRQSLNIEIGKVMATVDALQNQLHDIKNDLNVLNTHVNTLRDEVTRFIATVQTKSNCQMVHDKLKNDYVSKDELAPAKTLIKTICATTVTAICLAVMHLILK